MKSGVAVEKLHFSSKQPKFGDRKCPGKPRKSFVGASWSKGFWASFERLSSSTATGDFTHREILGVQPENAEIRHLGWS
jgi:hypothetical protein